MGVNSLLKTVTRQRRDCDLNPGPTAPESSTLTTRLGYRATLVMMYSLPAHAVIRGDSVCRRVFHKQNVGASAPTDTAADRCVEQMSSRRKQHNTTQQWRN